MPHIDSIYCYDIIKQRLFIYLNGGHFVIIADLEISEKEFQCLSQPYASVTFIKSFIWEVDGEYPTFTSERDSKIQQ